MKGKIVGILVAVAFVGLVGWRVASAAKARSTVVERAVEAPLVRTVKVTRASVEETLPLTGTIKAKRDVDVFAKLPGRVDHLAVEVGDRVRAGATLATVEHREISWQAKQAAAGVQAAKAALLVAEAGRDGAKLEYDRTKTLADGGAAPAATLEGAAIKLKLAEAQVAAAAAQVAQVSAAAGLAEQQVANARIEAPVDGVVTRRNVDLGAMAGQQLPAFSLHDARTLKLETSADLATFSRLEKGLPVRIEVEELPGESFEGKVAVLSPTLDAQTRRAALEIQIDNSSGRLLPNAFARAVITVGREENALVVPRDAVLDTADGPVIYRVRDGKAERIEPRLGPRAKGVVAVLAGLAEGDEVALGGLGQLSDGAVVRPSVVAHSSPVQAR